MPKSVGYADTTAEAKVRPKQDEVCIRKYFLFFCMHKKSIFIFAVFPEILKSTTIGVIC